LKLVVMAEVIIFVGFHQGLVFIFLGRITMSISIMLLPEKKWRKHS